MLFLIPRKSIILITSLALLAVLLIVFTNPWSTLGANSKNIALKSAAEVDRIVLADAYDSTKLNRQGELWMVNGSEVAAAIPVENILIAAERMEISSIVSSSSEQANSPSRNIAFFHGDKELLSYSLQIHNESYLLNLPGSDQSFYVKVSGYPGLNLDKVFSSSPNHFREHLLINLLPSEISRIEVELTDGEAYVFTQDQAGEISCKTSNDADPIPGEKLNELAIRLLFSYFSGIVYEDKSEITTNDLLGPEAGTRRMARLQVESFQGEKHTLQVFPYVENPGEEAHMFKALAAYNSEPNALIINYIYLDVLMRDPSRYLGEN
jgi:hypothetical protein